MVVRSSDNDDLRNSDDRLPALLASLGGAQKLPGGLIGLRGCGRCQRVFHGARPKSDDSTVEAMKWLRH